MSRVSIALFCAALALCAGSAYASGIPMATEWSWSRDGGRIFNAVVTLGAIAYLIVRYMGPVFKRRAELIAEQFEKLEEAREKAETSLAGYEEKFKAMEAESEKIKSEAKAEGEIIRQKMLEQVELDAKRIIEKAKDQIAMETEKAREALRREATRAAIDLAEELLKKNISQQDQEKLLENYISGMEKLN